MKLQKLNIFFACLLICLIAGCQSSKSIERKNTHAAGSDKKLVAANANIQLGMKYLQSGDVSTAKQKLLLALDLAPKYPAAWYTMAYYYEVTGEYNKANEYYLKAVDLAPKSGDVQNNYGTFLCHSGKPKEAIEHFLIAIQDPNYVDSAAAYENAGLCALYIPNKINAKEFFSKAVKQDPHRVRSLMELAKLQYESGEYKQASTNLNQLFGIAKPSPEALFLAIRVADKLQQFSQKQGYIEQLKRDYPFSVEAKSLI